MRVVNGWTILEQKVVGNSSGKRTHYVLRCKCGYEGTRRSDHVDSGRSKHCKSCSMAQSLKDHPNPVFGSKAHKGVGNLGRTFWTQIKFGAKRRGIPFSISIEYAWSLFDGRCALSGVPINLVSTTKNSAPCYSLFTASLDRKDSSKGYVEGNVQWVHKTINYIKRDLPDAEFVEWCKHVSSSA